MIARLTLTKLRVSYTYHLSETRHDDEQPTTEEKQN
jgi:hypothetical protein